MTDASAHAARLRLGVYVDLLYRRDDRGISSDRSFADFVAAMSERVDELVLFGRLDPRPGRAPHAVHGDGIRLVGLPFYPRTSSPGGIARAYRASSALFAAELGRLDAVWLFGPHPLSLAFARLARRQGTPVLLGVREDLPQYVRSRLGGPFGAWKLPAAYGLERQFTRLARRAPAVVVGDELARRYRRRGGVSVLSTGVSLVRADGIVTPEAALARCWAHELRLLTVGRLDPEKNPLLLAEVVAGLRARDRRWRLRVVGDGPLAEPLRQRARKLGVADAIELLGYVTAGPALEELYRSSHAFLHVSRTEGVPQVLVEAQAAGLPVVATDVGGVRGALDGGASGLLVPPGDAGAAVDAIDRLARDAQLRRRLVTAGARRAERETIDAQLDRIATFLRASL